MALIFLHEGIAFETIATIVAEVKMVLIHNDQVDIAVDAPIKSEIGGLGIDMIIRGVRDPDGDGIFVFEMIAHIEAEQGITAFMLAEEVVVEKDLAFGVHATEFEKEPFIIAHLGLGEFTEIERGCAKIIAAAVLAVLTIPGMGNRDFRSFERCAFLKRKLAFQKTPILIDRDDSPHEYPPKITP